MSVINGSFHFKLTNTGNLIGEYINNYDNVILSESANRISKGNGFPGEYLTSWIQNRQTAVISHLRIEEIPDEPFYKLTWIDLDKNIAFEGKATLLDETTIYGYYSGNHIITKD